MAELTVRRLMVDMDQPIARDWCDGDVFRSAFLNALSMSFPQGEQFFIDSVRQGAAQLAPEQRDALGRDIKGFVGQEATHRHLHSKYNGHLADLGYVNGWEARIVRRSAWLRGKDVRHCVAVTAAYEHFTAVLARWVLSHPHVLGARDERLKTLWLWHGAEESEHRSVAFDLYRALGGDERWRKRWFVRATWLFVTDALRQTISHLHHDKQLWRWATWRSAGVFLFGKQEGLVRTTWRDWRAYFRPDFHPDQEDDSVARSWLQTNAVKFQTVGQTQR